jgi:dienelactone hydrolase
MPTAHLVATEPVAGSRFPAELVLVETVDGTYTPIGLRRPEGDGPFPIVLLATGNGGGGVELLREHVHDLSWTADQLIEAGYATAWTRYRAEVDYAYDRVGPLVESGRQGRQLLNRGPLEYEDVIAVAEYVRTLPYVDPDRVGYLGMSHGGEMALKMASEWHGFGALVASEPAAHEFLRLRPDDTAQVDPATGLLDVDRMLMREPEKVRARITEDVARARVSTIRTPILVQGRDSDELQGIFRVSYDLLAEAGAPAEWATYDHALHGFVFPVRNADGGYDPDPVQRRAVADVLAFFGRHL